MTCAPTSPQQLPETIAYIKSRGDAWAMSRYAPGKWSVKEVINHLADAERVFTYRALRIARGDETPLPGFDENEWVPMMHADARSVADLLRRARRRACRHGRALQQLR